MKFIITIARLLSALFSPLLMGTYGIILAMWLSYLCYSPMRAKLIVIAVTFVATCAIPVIAIFLLNRLGVVKNPRLNDRADRTVPYIICTICYLALAIYYHFVNAPIWLSMLMLGGAGALIVLSIVNRWWKISVHAAGIAGIVALLLRMFMAGDTVTRHPVVAYRLRRTGRYARLCPHLARAPHSDAGTRRICRGIL